MQNTLLAVEIGVSLFIATHAYLNICPAMSPQSMVMSGPVPLAMASQWLSFTQYSEKTSDF